MELYEKVSYELSKCLTERYSTSFGMSARLFDRTIRGDIYAIYGLVRIADEIVDAYRGVDAKVLLENLEAATYAAIERGYDTNPIVHSYALTAKKYGIDSELIQPFFASMAMDLVPAEYTDELYESYIYGSAEVIGLMCLRVFCAGDSAQYEELKPGAQALGSAYQKVNFLRDIAADFKELDRVYFPGVTYENFNDEAKQRIVADITRDVKKARAYADNLPDNSRRAVKLSMSYYDELLRRISYTSATTLKNERVRIGNARKVALLLLARIGVGK